MQRNARGEGNSGRANFTAVEEPSKFLSSFPFTVISRPFRLAIRCRDSSVFTAYPVISQDRIVFPASPLSLASPRRCPTLLKSMSRSPYLCREPHPALRALPRARRDVYLSNINFYETARAGVMRKLRILSYLLIFESRLKVCPIYAAERGRRGNGSRGKRGK